MTLRFLALMLPCAALFAAGSLPPPKIDPIPKPLASDPSVKIDYDIVYVRAPRFFPGRDGKKRPSRWPEIAGEASLDAASWHADGVGEGPPGERDAGGAEVLGEGVNVVTCSRPALEGLGYTSQAP